ncbi:MAG: antitoxin HicB [Bacteroidetes bacterium GWE2_41_25]|nr:MAG: antitoxin HicB [Bacteroidetes bacterium GWA2_40_15]OFX93473.1 MAG: antitoxin HicB [Bacteroidetes bacterium GWE2_41_25]OFX95044.1 MAG: antitoxin HicB [Bacteroidetes bacterium GWC2_40_22]OFY59957.1 MAG: antitoxin HicB [Bacteroidetes bacterium GWF2_41_9]HBH84956.1 toxin-antitoxin system HicB family antitoxin [Bacteroidales bacterium]
MNTLKYKDFIGSVNFSEEDGVFFGKIEGINALVTFEGESVKKLKEAFREAISDYLELCRAKGIKPYKTYTGVFNVRLTPEIHKKAAIEAIKSGTTLNGFIKKAVEKELRVDN